jgi:CoA:oxalate CoA-transferase
MHKSHSAPLSGVTILDLTHVLAGPFASHSLADLGALVIKVERPILGDDTRAFPPFVQGKSVYFAALNAGKQSIALDLKDQNDRAVFDALLERCDILLENFRPGVMERLGYAWDALHARYPRLIYGAVSGFGHTGPDSQMPAYDMVVQARGGVMAITGPEGGAPVRVGASIGDITAGMFLTQGVLAALYAREKSGIGAKIDVAMLDAQLAIQEHAIAITVATGKAPHATGARHPTITPFSTYAAADGSVVITAGTDAMFVQLCKALALPIAADDPRFSTNLARCEHHLALAQIIETVTKTAPAAHWIGVLTAAGLPCAQVQDMAAVLRDPQLIARNMVLPVAGDAGLVSAGNPIKMSSLPEITARPAAPQLDQDRAAILRWLGR